MAEFEIYEFEIAITLRRKTDRYSSTNLVKFSTDQEKPLRDDDSARVELVNMVREASGAANEIVATRIDFEDTVRRLEAGDTVDA